MFKFETPQLENQEQKIFFPGIKNIFEADKNLAKESFLDALSREDWIEEVNLADYFSDDIKEVFNKVLLSKNNQVDSDVDIFAPASSKTQDSPSLNTFLSAFLKHKKVKKILLNAGFKPNNILLKSSVKGAKVDNLINSTESLFNHAAVIAVESGSSEIDISHVLKALKTHSQKFVNSMAENSVDDAALETALLWHNLDQKINTKKFFREQKTNWTNSLSKEAREYLIDLSQFAKDTSLHSQIVGRDGDIVSLAASLAKNNAQNAILVGAEGVGKKTVVNGLAAKIISGEAPENIKQKRVFELNLKRLFDLEGFGAKKEALFKVLNEVAKHRNIILFIDNLPNFLNQDFDTNDVLDSILSSDRLQVIASITPSSFYKLIEPSPSISAKFDRLNIENIFGEKALSALGNVAQFLELQYGIILSVPATQKALFWAKEYLNQAPLLEGAIRILETAAVNVSYRENKLERFVSLDDIEQAVMSIAGVSLVDLNSAQKDATNLDELLKEKIIGQNEAVVAIDEAFKKAERGLSFQAKPMTSLLFMGPAGAGKTYTAHVLADICFDSKMTAIDCNLFRGQSGEFLQDLGRTATKNPNSIILLENIHSLGADIIDDLTNILNTACLELNDGKKMSLSGYTLILTSNGGDFKDEFLGQFDGIAKFEELKFDSLMQIIDLQIANLNKHLKDKGVSVGLTPSAKEIIVNTDFDIKKGAHHLNLAIKSRVEDLVLDQLLEGKIKAGDRTILDASDLI